MPVADNDIDQILGTSSTADIDQTQVLPAVEASPAVESAHLTLKDRLLRRLSLASVYVKEGMGRFGDWLSDEEKGRRRGITAGVIGVAAVGGAMLAAKYGSDMFGHVAHGQGGSAGTGGHIGEAIRDNMTLHQGDTIWGDLSREASQHGHHLSEAQIHQLTGQTLEANGLTWEDARHLPVGFNFTIPDEVREQLAQAA
jgi:hypothetical protein